jgi:hypothetical protein
LPLGLFSHDYAPETQPTFKFLLVTLEAILITAIVHTVRWGHRERRHDKWLEYRALAEMLWDVRFLSYLGEHGRMQRIGELESDPSGRFLWYLQATIREIGLPNALLDGSYQRALLNAFDKQVIADQINWNKWNAKTLRRLDLLFHLAGDTCFIVTGAILVLFFSVHLRSRNVRGRAQYRRNPGRRQLRSDGD